MVGQKRYELADHLGNVRAVVSDEPLDNPVGGVGGRKPELLAYYNYYPFGLEQPGRTNPGNGTLAGGYRFGFNGKEKDNNGELGLTNYDYGARIYNSAYAKFLSVDPLADSFPWNSPFSYAEGDPINYIDLDGSEKPPLTAAQTATRVRPVLSKAAKEPTKREAIDAGGRALKKVVPKVLPKAVPFIDGVGIECACYG